MAGLDAEVTKRDTMATTGLIYLEALRAQAAVVARKDDAPYRNHFSQTMNILKPKDQLMRIYPIFHFVPGEPDAPSARRRDGKMHILNTTPSMVSEA